MNNVVRAHKWLDQGPKRRTANPVVKPIRSARELAVGEELRKVNEEGNHVWELLSEAVMRQQEATGVHLVKRAIELQGRADELQADLQAMAGEGTQGRRIAA